MTLPFCEFQIEMNTIIIYKNHLLTGEVAIQQGF